jgi:lipopolysaccharide export system protein LptA
MSAAGQRWRGLLAALLVLGGGAALAQQPPAIPSPPAEATLGAQPKQGGAAPGTALLGMPNGKEGLPVAVEADQGIEWQQEKQLYIARGNAKAVRGDVTVYGQVLMAYYRKTPSGGSDIWRLEADDKVKITSPTATALGDRAIYDVDNAIFVLTGKALDLTLPKTDIKARDSLEYWQQKQYAVARGDAVATREDKTVRADILTAHLKPDQKGELQISSIEAFRNVVIATQSAVARALYGDYNLDSGIAVLKGSVKITRGEDQLDGECAEVNMNTGISRLFACAKEDRVRGLIAPKQGEQGLPGMPGGGGAGQSAPGGAKRK